MASIRHVANGVGLTLFAAAASTHAQLVHPLNPIGGAISSYAQSINSSGIVVGYSTNPDFIDLPTLWRPTTGGTYTAESLPLPSGTTSGGANAIGPTGIIVGYAQPADASTATAVIWTPTGPGGAYVAATLAAPMGMDYNAAYAVNSAGQVAGFGGSSSGGSVAMAWSPAAVPLSTLPSDHSILASGISDAGDIVGYGSGPDATAVSYVWSPDGAGGYIPKRVFATDSAAVTAINEHGTGAGVYQGHEPLVMALYEGDYYAFSLPMPDNFSDGVSIAVNNLDGLVGSAKDPNSGVAGDEAAFWLPTDTFWDYVNLDRWLDQTSSSQGAHWQLQEATGINDNWLVVGNGLYDPLGNPNGPGATSQAYVLDISSLLPEPSIPLILAGVVLACIRRTRRQGI